MGHSVFFCDYYRNASTAEDTPTAIVPDPISTPVPGPTTVHSAVHTSVPTIITDLTDDEEGNITNGSYSINCLDQDCNHFKFLLCSMHLVDS